MEVAEFEERRGKWFEGFEVVTGEMDPPPPAVVPADGDEEEEAEDDEERAMFAKREKADEVERWFGRFDAGLESPVILRGISCAAAY